MKKIVALLAIGMLAACTYANNSINFLPFRNQIFTYWQTDSVFYYDPSLNDEFLSESQTTVEDKIERGQVLITHTGESMASSRTYRTDYYSTETIRPNQNGILDSVYSPVHINKKGSYNAFGEVTHDGQRYMLVREGKSKDIILVTPDGEIYDHIGRMVGKRLIVLSAQFYVKPADLKMVPVIDTRSEVMEDSAGYKLIYNGLLNDGEDIVFTYEEKGLKPEEIRFSICDEKINIHGLNIDIINASEDKIEYMIK